ncbi:helicase SKI2W [Vespula pensylvanica]|uniref:helicase SKI2W n=1 Tax=Vespula pensylvanica TaxID=30213 RepID=UPI001CBA1877|nr:helicase SKI2W [Vespula pensylvanica]
MELPFELPPIWPEINTVLKEYIECPERLPIHQLDHAQCYWPREPDIRSLLEFDLAPLSTTLKFDRDPVTGHIGQMQEVVLKGVGENARNSMSMNRLPGSIMDDVRGNITNIPFLPGGFDEPTITDEMTEDIDFESNLRTLAIGFSSGVEFEADNCTPKQGSMCRPIQISEAKGEDENDITSKINLMALVEQEERELSFWSSTEEVEENDVQEPPQIPALEDIPLLPIEPEIPVLNISEESSKVVEMEWAEQIDVSVPIIDYEKKIPDPAITFEYELDTFQKQAILKLEENCNVFVAAHTSAGKTTVAEYAIALTQKHMTRVIYTSPIKALSNQKYRDFKKKFESVGLITGDVQINESASCLIMTTEILQSMIYGASEVLRDLEFVIFDEVHYINNEDRGHVWEEIVILLPQTVNIVMLSATVPKPIIFANWVGRIKKRKMYVISTLKRPVPLQHYLYTPINDKDKGTLILVLDSNEEFSLNGWHQATKNFQSVIKLPQDKSTNSKDNKRRKFSAKEEMILWKNFINYLKHNDKLPVVVFTLSRRRCDINASRLMNIQLTTATEKMEVKRFFQHIMKYLKGSDKQLPQVCMMQNLLENGIGIHHSGILPILKETVEMLFQTGVVKLLFATETFAMGVNMPARTVAFDSINKYDGNGFRTFYPTEYIQMAGRAGRRGHDTTGTVIIICHREIPHFNELMPMMQGEARTLESQFKVTYSMVLNLRRTNKLVTVEAMMRRSFKESCLILKEDKYQIDLRKVEEKLATLPPFTNIQKKLSGFYEIAINYLQELRYLKPYMFESKKAIKSLTKGRILIISYANHYRNLAVLLTVLPRKQNGNQYKVLILKNADAQNDNNDTLPENSSKTNTKERSENWYSIISLTKRNLFVPTGVPSHEVLTICAWDILEITNCQIKVDCGMVLKDWEKRQISRFRHDLPGPTCQTAIQELMAISLSAANDHSILLPYVPLKVTENLNPRMKHLCKQKQALNSMKYIDIPNFEEQFEAVFYRNELETERKKLQLSLSDEGLSLYPDYINMVSLLKHLGYIDSDERIALKGRVALQIGINELLITELILKNVLTILQPAEIAALLSALIFHQKSNSESTFPVDFHHLRKEYEIMQNVYTELQQLEQIYHLNTLQPLNFGLVEVVYEWAQSKSFAEIMQKIDVQEGIIVRCIQQLNETLQDVRNAAVTIGDPVLKEKMEEASTAIKRDIVFAASLYTQD